MKNHHTYKNAGVDIEAGDEAVHKIKRLAKFTKIPGVLGDIGSFGALFEINKAQYRKPVLISSTDGVGTKLKIAFLADNHDTIGIDLVAMGVNDILALGAKPLFFLDYIGCHKVEQNTIVSIISGIAHGCREAGCALIGGEIAELSDMYQKGEYDLAGFAVGIVDKNKIIDGSKIKAGDKLIGIRSAGLHSNGYTLARKVLFESLKLHLNSYPDQIPGTLGDELLKPTKIYVKPVLALLKKFKIAGLAHITGGGIAGNLVRIIPRGLKAVIDTKSWKPQPIFNLLTHKGEIEREEMFKVFNMGIGFIVVASAKNAKAVRAELAKHKEKAYLIGEVVEGGKGKAEVVIE